MKTLKQLIQNSIHPKYNPEGYRIEEYTCYECPYWRECRSAFDVYNVNGECLEGK